MALPSEDDRDAIERAFAELVAGYHLTADAPGRVTLPLEAAIHQISLQSDTHFDPQLLELFVQVVKNSPVSPRTMEIAPAA